MTILFAISIGVKLGILFVFIAALVIFARVMRAKNKKKKKRNRHY